MKKGIFYLMFSSGIISVLYFSWIESPRLSLNGVLPEWVTRWTDKHENENLRTAIPFIFISILIGIRLIYNNEVLKTWVLYYILLVLVIFMAEIGQLFLPLRIFDWEDIFWGVIVSSVILPVFYILGRLKSKLISKY